MIHDGMNSVMDTAMTVELIPPEQLSPRDRAREAAVLIAAAIARLHATLPRGDVVSLGFSVTKRLHTTPSERGS